METISVRSSQRSEMIEVTAQIQTHVSQSGLQDGVIDLFVPHTTAGITVNENADPTVEHDLLAELDRLIPWSQPHFTHREGNSAAHIKSALLGSSVRVPIRAGRLALGTWQGIFFCEFDGPRTRKVHIQHTQG